jgi:glycosyltransferase involved in cell wall biosynthesis
LPGELLEGVVFTGEMPDEDLSCFFSGADLYVSASLYEGFGLPLLEAMACGTPVVALKTPSLEEVIGDAGYMVEENSPEEFAEAVYNILSDVNKQRSMIENGFKRAQIFSWKKTASKTLEVYEEVGRA